MIGRENLLSYIWPWRVTRKDKTDFVCPVQNSSALTYSSREVCYSFILYKRTSIIKEMFHFSYQKISRHLFFLFPVIFFVSLDNSYRYYWCCRRGPAPSAGGHTRPLHDLPQALLRVQLPRPPQQGPGPTSQTSRGETQPPVPHSSTRVADPYTGFIWIRIQHFRLNTNPDPTDPIRIQGFWWPKIK